MVMTMNYKEFMKLLKKNELNQVYLFYGNERYLINWAIESLKKKYITPEFENFNFNTIDIRQSKADEIINICETLPMMTEKRLVLIDRYSVLEGEKVKNFGEHDEKKLASYLDQVAETCIVILICGEKLDKRKSIYKKLNKINSVFEFSKLTPIDLRKWIEKRLKSAGKTISQKNSHLLIENTGYLDKDSEYTLYNLENDIKKILHYAGDENEIIEPHIMGSISLSLEKNIFTLIDAISNRNKEQGLKILNNVLLYGEAEYKILALIHRQYDNMLKVKMMKENGKDIAYMKQQLKLPDFVIKKLLKSTNGLTLNVLEKNIIKMYETDKNIKTGVMDPRLALEMLIAQL